MLALTKDTKLLTLSLILRTMPREQQSLLLAHFSPEVVKMLSMIEQQTESSVEQLDWTPFYQSWPELKQILDDCRKEIRTQKLSAQAEQQRPKLKEYILQKLGKKKKGPPVFLSQEITKIIDHYVENIKKGN